MVKKSAPKKAPKRGTTARSKHKKAPQKKPTIAKKKGKSPEISYQFTSTSVIVNFPEMVDGKRRFRTKTVAAGSTEYIKIKEAIRKGLTNKLPDIMNKGEQIVQKHILLSNDKDVKFEDGVVLIRVQKEFIPVPIELGKRIIAYAEENLPFSDLKAFFKNLIENPSRTSMQSLWRFLEKNHFPITPDGCFIAYKGVSGDFKDLHTGTFDNSVGRVVKVRRNEVDEDIRQQCSRGLHVASYNYAHRLYGGGYVIEVKVNPRDVVAVPIGETDEKMRVCQYKSVGISQHEITEQRVDYYEDEYEEDEDDPFYLPEEIMQ